MVLTCAVHVTGEQRLVGLMESSTMLFGAGDFQGQNRCSCHTSSQFKDIPRNIGHCEEHAHKYFGLEGLGSASRAASHFTCLRSIRRRRGPPYQHCMTNADYGDMLMRACDVQMIHTAWTGFSEMCCICPQVPMQACGALLRSIISASMELCVFGN
jgi:hypothetical protein